MKIGTTIRIKKCDPIPEVVGESAEIVDVQVQEPEKDAASSLWIKLTSGERKGKIYKFRYDEIEVCSDAQTMQKATVRKVVTQIEELMKSITTLEEIVEVERIIEKVKGKVLAEQGMGFWEGKTPCWEMFRCPGIIKNDCPAFKYRAFPCWQIEGTFTKLRDYGQGGNKTDICQVCQIYKRYGHGEPIQIRLFGKGIDSLLKSVSCGESLAK